MHIDTSIGKNFVRIYVENVVIFCHGLPYDPGSVIEKSYDQLARFFTGGGLDSVIFDFSGCGLSRGDFSLTAWLEDLINIVSGFSRVDLVGFSMGGVAATYVAASLDNVRSLVLVASPCCADSVSEEVLGKIYLNARSKGVLRGIGSYGSFVSRLRDELGEYEPVKWIDSVKKPVLIVHGTKDDVIPYESAEELFEKARQPKYLLRVINGNHRLRKERAVMEYILKWLKKKKSGKVIEEIQL